MSTDMESQLRAPNSQPLTNLAAVLEHQHHLILLGRRRKGAEMLHTCWPDSLWSQWELCLCTNSVPRCKNEGDRVLGKYFPCTVCVQSSLRHLMSAEGRNYYNITLRYSAPVFVQLSVQLWAGFSFCIYLQKINSQSCLTMWKDFY